MEYKYNKYLYKSKQLAGGIITDNIINDHCEEPNYIRVLQHPVTNKLIIILGEKHKSHEFRFTDKQYKRRADRIDPTKGIDLIMGQISKRISMAQGKLDNPFNKVLFMTEEMPSQILLGGNNKELAPDLFKDVDEVWQVSYVYDKFNFICNKYKNTLLRNINIRKTLGISNGMYVVLKQHVDIIKEIKPAIPSIDLCIDIFYLFNDALDNIFKYVYNDQPFKNPPVDHTPPFAEEINKTFFGETYTRRPSIFPRRLSEVFIHTSNIYTVLNQLFITYIDELLKNDPTGSGILFESKYDHLSANDRLELFYDTIKGINPLIGRIMDLYILEHIHLMDNNTTTIIYTGTKHSEFIYYELLLCEGYQLKEMETIKYSEGTECNRIFPSDEINIDELNTKCNSIKNMYDTESEYRKKIFIKNLIIFDGDWEKKFNTNPNDLFA
jgi:hypothetical protein